MNLSRDTIIDWLEYYLGLSLSTMADHRLSDLRSVCRSHFHTWWFTLSTRAQWSGDNFFSSLMGLFCFTPFLLWACIRIVAWVVPERNWSRTPFQKCLCMPSTTVPRKKINLNSPKLESASGNLKILIFTHRYHHRGAWSVCAEILSSWSTQAGDGVSVI